MPRTTDETILLGRFFDADGRLIVVPRRRSDRQIVFAHIAEAVAPGVEHEEWHVNAAMRPFGDDVALLRRYLVDEGFLARRPPGVYRRIEPA